MNAPQPANQADPFLRMNGNQNLIPQTVPEFNFTRTYHCPITQEPFKDPIITRCGHTFERSAWKQHIDRFPVEQNGGKVSCPMHPGDLVSRKVSTNFAIKEATENLKFDEQYPDDLIPSEGEDRLNMFLRVAIKDKAEMRSTQVALRGQIVLIADMNDRLSQALVQSNMTIRTLQSDVLKGKEVIDQKDLEITTTKMSLMQSDMKIDRMREKNTSLRQEVRYHRSEAERISARVSKLEKEANSGWHEKWCSFVESSIAPVEKVLKGKGLL